MNDLELAWARFELAWNHLNSEIQIIWTRFSAFLIIEAALIAFAAQSTRWVLLVILCVFGVLITVVWWGVTSASLMWLEHWRAVAYEREQALPGIEHPSRRSRHSRRGMLAYDLTHLWARAEPLKTSDKWENKWRPTRIAVWTPRLVLSFWVLAGVYFGLEAWHAGSWFSTVPGGTETGK